MNPWQKAAQAVGIVIVSAFLIAVAITVLAVITLGIVETWKWIL